MNESTGERRVFDVARELNVTTNTILEIAQSFGHSIEMDIMQPLSDDIYKKIAGKIKSEREAIDERQSKSRIESILSAFSADDKVRAMVGGFLERLRGDLDDVSKSVMKFISSRNFDGAKERIDRAAAVSTFLHRFENALTGTGGAAVAPPPQIVPMKDEPPKWKKSGGGRLKPGQLTQTSDYFIPVLKALVDFGGSARKYDVVDRVEVAMQGKFTDRDLEPPPSQPQTPRWRIKIDQVLTALINKGLLEKDSPKGIWMISPVGMQYVSEETG